MALKALRYMVSPEIIYLNKALISKEPKRTKNSFTLR